MTMIDVHRVKRVWPAPLALPQGRCQCIGVPMGSYLAQASVITPQHRLAGIDICILPTVVALWSRGIETIESCCGHGVTSGYIAVRPAHVAEMEALGFHHDPQADDPSFVFLWPRD